VNHVVSGVVSHVVCGVVSHVVSVVSDVVIDVDVGDYVVGVYKIDILHKKDQLQ
jgi:hypothetical protein